jgi:hypothetical protein
MAPGCSGQPAWQNKNRMRGNFNFDSFIVRLNNFIPKSLSMGKETRLDAFNDLASELFALQFAQNPVYRNFCERRGIIPGRLGHWSNIPSVPTSVFKDNDLSCLEPEERTSVFHSSGTTEQRPSRHFHNEGSLRIYEKSLLNWFRFNLYPNHLRAKTRDESSIIPYALNLAPWADDGPLVVLTPNPTDAPHSSLVHMFDTIRQATKQPSTAYYGKVNAEGAWQLDFERLVEALKAIAIDNKPCLIFGTAFSFVHLLDQFEEHDLRIRLPTGSRVLETGGYKGRSRWMEKNELYVWMEKKLGIDQYNIVGEYGMSELSSQAYSLHHACDIQSPALPKDTFQFPPWAQVQVISPETGIEVSEGETGLVRVFDLANTYSVMAIQTEDLAIRRANGFELLGRSKTAEPRGCSLMAT